MQYEAIPNLNAHSPGGCTISLKCILGYDDHHSITCQLLPHREQYQDPTYSTLPTWQPMHAYSIETVKCEPPPQLASSD